MNKAVFTQVVRKSFAELAIGVAACGAGYMFLVEPMNAKLADAERETNNLQHAITTLRSTPSTVANSAQATDSAKAIIARIDERGAPAREHMAMLQTIMALADKSGVSIEQFNPGTPRGPRAPKSPAPAASTPTSQAQGAQHNNPTGPQVAGLAPGGAQGTPPGNGAAAPAKPDAKLETRSAYSINLKGPFTNVIAFVHALQHDVGFTTIRTLNISPSSGDKPNMVTVTMETEHVAVNTKVLTAPPTPATSGPGGPMASVRAMDMQGASK